MLLGKGGNLFKSKCLLILQDRCITNEAVTVINTYRFFKYS